MMKGLKLLFWVTAFVAVLAALMAAAIGQPSTTPIFLLVDASGSSSIMKVRMAIHAQVAGVLSEMPPGTPFRIVTFNHNSSLIYSGNASIRDSLAAATALDAVKATGPTDLGQALAFTSTQVGSSTTYDAVIISDFQLAVPHGSAWAGMDLPTLLKQAHQRNGRRFLLIPVGRRAQLNGLPAYAEVFSGNASNWMAQHSPSVPAPAPINVPPFWQGGPFILAVLITTILVLGAIHPLLKYFKGRRALADASQLLKPAHDNEEPEPPAPVQVQASQPPVRSFVAAILETGEEVGVGAEPVSIGCSPLAKLYLDEAITTVTLRSKVDFAGQFLLIQNSGERAVHFGALQLAPKTTARLPWGWRSDCKISRQQTLRIYSVEEVLHDAAQG